jgi:hypothetical protein
MKDFQGISNETEWKIHDSRIKCTERLSLRGVLGEMEGYDWDSVGICCMEVGYFLKDGSCLKFMFVCKLGIM